MPPPTRQFDVVALERELERTEHADAEAHKVYNNLGVAHTAAGRHRDALRAHREEKRACKRLASQPGAAPARLVDLAIAYRRTGDATLRVDAVTWGGARRAAETRADIARRAHVQHGKALEMAAAAAAADAPGARLEVQCAAAAMAQSALIIALDTRDPSDFEFVIGLCARAASFAEQLTDRETGGRKARVSMTLSAALNLAVAMSGYGDKKRAKALFEATGVRARKEHDLPNVARCIANLAEEAGDDGDWATCLEFVDEWMEVAKEQGDEGDEADALRKRGTALFEMHRYEEARIALDRAAILGRDEFAREEARRNLQLVETELEEVRVAEHELEDLKPKCIAFSEAGDAVEEARVQLSAGETAFKLRRYKVVFEHLTRYFELVDEHGCFTTATGVEPLRHCLAVANMAESHWRTGNYAEAVAWGMRELAVYEGDVAGQAQAWCNIGVYLDDDGKYERSKEALLKSIDIAREAGDIAIQESAESNLKVVEENLKKHAYGTPPYDVASEVAAVGLDDEPLVNERQSSQLNSRNWSTDFGNDPQARTRPFVTTVNSSRHSNRETGRAAKIQHEVTESASFGQVHAAEHSIVVESGELMDTRLGASRNRYTRDSHSGAHETTIGSRSAADRSSAGTRRFVDLCALFQKRYEAYFQNSSRPFPEPRSCIVEELRKLSGKIVAYDEMDVIDANFSEKFLSDDEFIPLMQACAALPELEPRVRMNFRLNPLIGPTSFRWLSSVVGNGLRRPFSSIVSLDLSSTGMDSSCLAMLARSLRPGGSLPLVSSLSVGKNCLGNNPGLAAESVATIMLRASHLKTLDLSLNLLPKSFLPQLANAAERLRSSTGGSESITSVESLDLSLNNRRNPDALLEYRDDFKAPALCLRRVLKAVPSLRLVDVRACGAPGPVRRKLFEVEIELRQRSMSGSEICAHPREILITSSDVYDVEEDAALQATDL